MRAHIPEDKRFTRDHVWICMVDEFTGRCGITPERLSVAGEIVFIEFPEVDTEVRAGDSLASIESNQQLFRLRAPVSGRITEVNRALMDRPDSMNSDPYGEGWVLAIDVKEPNEFIDLLDEDGYHGYLEREGDI